MYALEMDTLVLFLFSSRIRTKIDSIGNYCDVKNVPMRWNNVYLH